MEEVALQHNETPTHTVDATDDALALARKLGARLAQRGDAAHELRLARALMLDVVELLESRSLAL